MKSVGKQLEEARQARNWTPELAARETKIKVDRLRDLEADDYTHFSSPTYARGFVRTYARALGLDEYKILRQLDNKLPEDETSSFAADTGVPYIPEPTKANHASSGSNAGLYISLSLGFGVVLVMVFVLFEAYRAGVLPSYFADTSNSENTSPPTAATNITSAETPRALPVDPNAAPPPATNDIADTSSSPRALPVDPSSLAATASSTNAAPATDAPIQSVRALPVDPSDLTHAPPQQVASATLPAEAPPIPPSAPTNDVDTSNAPRALPVSPEELAAAATPPPPPLPPPPATNAPDTDGPPTPPPITLSARQSDTGPVQMPTDALPPPPPQIPATVVAPTNDLTQATTAPTPDKRLILTASRDSFIRVTEEDGANPEQVLYASVLHTGQSVGFDGRKFSINVGIPAAIDITLDGVNYGPHSDQEAPETFTVESHQP